MRARGETIVLTNGCFDLLHVGHVRYLLAARGLGDTLAVGLNADISMRALKGAGRPFVPQSERAEILAALSCVDYVTIFDEETAYDLVDAIQPHVYVKGGDYSTDPADSRFPPEGRAVIAHGGTIRVIDYVAGISTTELVRRIRRSANDEL